MEDLPEPVSVQCNNEIENQINNSFCKINLKNGKFQFGIFCYIKYENKNIPLLLTQYDVINEKYLSNNNNINVFFKDKIKTIEFGDAKYLNKKYNIALIEIKEEKDDKISYLEFDDCLCSKNYEICLLRNSIYIIQYYYKILISYGRILNINNSDIAYSSYINSLKILFPIFNINNNKLIGIHIKTSNFNQRGILFNCIINEFIKIYKYSRSKYRNDNNEIILLIKANKNNINKKLYFLDNFDDKHNNLKDLNQLNTKLYINDKEEKYEKFFIPKKEDIYKIQLKFKTIFENSSYMFAGCDNLLKINFISFNSKYIKNMKYMFYNCKNLKNINLFSFNTENVTNMSHMFDGCDKITNLDLSFFNTKNVINMSHMFNDCSNLNYLDISSFDCKKVNEMNDIFCNCWNLNKINIKNNEFIQKIKELKEINLLILIDEKDVKKIVNILSFETGKRHINIPNFEDDFDYGIEDLIGVGCKEIIKKSEYEVFINNIKIAKKYKDTFKPEKSGTYNIKIKFKKNLNNCSCMFAGCKDIIKINLISFDTSLVTNMSFMFYWCLKLKNINLLYFDTKNVTDMECMFAGNSSMTELDLSNFDTEKVRNMNSMFNECSSLTSLFLNSFNTKNVVDMGCMFYECSSLTNLNITSFNTKNVNFMEGMFYKCINLKNIDLSNFNTPNLKNIKFMFFNCKSLISLDLKSFNTTKVIDMDYMFCECSSLKKLNLLHFDTKNIKKIEKMFFGCNALNKNVLTFDSKILNSLNNYK